MVNGEWGMLDWEIGGMGRGKRGGRGEGKD